MKASTREGRLLEQPRGFARAKQQAKERETPLPYLKQMLAPRGNADSRPRNRSPWAVWRTVCRRTSAF